MGSGAVLWETGTQGQKLVMQGDGNLVIYDRDGGATWSSVTAGHPGAVFCASEEGGLVVLGSDGTLLWSAELAKGPQPDQSARIRPVFPSAGGHEAAGVTADDYRKLIESLTPAVRMVR